MGRQPQEGLDRDLDAVAPSPLLPHPCHDAVDQQVRDLADPALDHGSLRPGRDETVAWVASPHVAVEEREEPYRVLDLRPQAEPVGGQGQAALALHLDLSYLPAQRSGKLGSLPR